MKEEQDLETICDNLIDRNVVNQGRYDILKGSFESYKKANSLLGYFSQLRDYNAEYERLLKKVLQHRKDLLRRYKDDLTDECGQIFKQLLISPLKTEWYIQGIHKFRKVKNYSTYYYRRQLYVLIENHEFDLKEMKRLLENIIALDKYYDIYEETIGFFMTTSDMFEQAMRRHFPDRIHL